jgi:hypothetical protein
MAVSVLALSPSLWPRRLPLLWCVVEFIYDNSRSRGSSGHKSHILTRFVVFLCVFETGLVVVVVIVVVVVG